MAQFKLVVLVNPKPGREAEFNRWYDDQHLDDLLRVPGIVGAERFKLAVSDAQWKYFTVYDLETDDPKSVVDDVLARAGTAEMPMPDVLDTEGVFMATYQSVKKV